MRLPQTRPRRKLFPQTEANSSPNRARRNGARGWSLLELTFTLGIFAITAAICVPILDGTYLNYRLRASVSTVTWAVSTTRYQAIMKGYPFQLAIDSTKNQYQILSDPTNSGTFSNVGGAIPIPTAGMTISASTTLQFKPNGSVAAPVGALNFNMTYEGQTKTITVSTYGNVSVTP